MPSIISRAYADRKTADAAKAALAAAGFDAVEVAFGDGAAGALPVGALGSKGKEAAAAALAAGRAILIAKAAFGTAYRAGVIADRFSPVSVPGIGSDAYVMEDSRRSLLGRILTDHPRFLTQDFDVSSKRRGLITPAFGMPLLKARSGSRSAWSGTVRMSRAFWPTPLLSTKARRNSAWSGTHRMSRFFWPAKLISGR